MRHWGLHRYLLRSLLKQQRSRLHWQQRRSLHCHVNVAPHPTYRIEMGNSGLGQGCFWGPVWNSWWNPDDSTSEMLKARNDQTPQPRRTFGLWAALLGLGTSLGSACPDSNGYSGFQGSLSTTARLQL